MYGGIYTVLIDRDGLSQEDQIEASFKALERDGLSNPNSSYLLL